MYHSIWDLSDLKEIRSRSVTPENPDGSQGGGARCKPEEGTASVAARDLGKGWKVNPFVRIGAGETFTLADIQGPGILRHIWMTPTGKWRDAILRFYWDGQSQPSVEVPVGDFFASGWGVYAPLSSIAVCVNPGSAFNCYWQMPFQKHCRITLENRSPDTMIYYYQIDYTLQELPDNIAYFHAQLRQSRPLDYKQVHTILDGVSGCGVYLGTYIAWGSHSSGWWGEGEMKFYLDGDLEYPTLCGTGTEDYFCGSYNFENPHNHRYEAFCTPYAGLHQILLPDGLYQSQTRFGMYRWHLPDPIVFHEDIRVTIQALGWRSDGRYLPLKDDISSVAYWMQELPTGLFSTLPDRDNLEVI